MRPKKEMKLLQLLLQNLPHLPQLLEGWHMNCSIMLDGMRRKAFMKDPVATLPQFLENKRSKLEDSWFS